LPLNQFKIPISILRTDATIQESAVEFIILRMFDHDTIFSLLKVLFRAIEDDYTIFS
jgi:hypothetical protein